MKIAKDLIVLSSFWQKVLIANDDSNATEHQHSETKQSRQTWDEIIEKNVRRSLWISEKSFSTIWSWTIIILLLLSHTDEMKNHYRLLLTCFHERTKRCINQQTNKQTNKQCFYCQWYNYIISICRYKRRCLICFEQHNEETCKISTNNKNALIAMTIIRFNRFNTKSEWQKKQNDDDLKNEIDFTFNDYDKMNIHLMRNRRQCDVKLKSRYIVNIFLFFFNLVLKNCNALKNIMHLKTNNYLIDEITKKRTLSKISKRNMSSFSR